MFTLKLRLKKGQHKNDERCRYRSIRKRVYTKNSTNATNKRAVFSRTLFQQVVDRHDFVRLIGKWVGTTLRNSTGGLCIHFQGTKLHALFYRPGRRGPLYHPANIGRKLATQAIL